MQQRKQVATITPNLDLVQALLITLASDVKTTAAQRLHQGVSVYYKTMYQYYLLDTREPIVTLIMAHDGSTAGQRLQGRGHAQPL